MIFHTIQQSTWDRKEIFEHFLQQNTTFSITHELDITLLQRYISTSPYRFYPAFIYLVTQVINTHNHFRMSITPEGELGYWSHLHPSYTIFDKSSTLFSAIHTEMQPTFAAFYYAFLQDHKQYANRGQLSPKQPTPPNCFPISMLPWVSFTGFNLNIGNNASFLFPIITAGKFFERGNAIYLPLSLQVHHAVCDGYHAAYFINTLQEMMNTPEKFL